MEMHACEVVSQFALGIILALTPGVEAQPINIVEQLNQSGIEKFKLSSYQDALLSFSSALHIYEQSGDAKGEATALSEIAMCLYALGQTQKALDHLEKALPKWEQAQDRDNLASTLGKEGDIYRLWGFPDQAHLR